jgi:5-methylcytosine-specific restriction endonuclease McrA
VVKEMARYKRKYRQSSGKMSLRKARTLVREVEVSIERREKERQQLGNIDEAKRKLESIGSQITSLLEKIGHQKRNQVPRKGMLPRIFGWTEIAPHARSAIADLESQVRVLYDQQRELRSGVVDKNALLERSLFYDRKRLADLKPILERLEKKEGAMIALKNKAAANSAEKRAIGASVKKRLTTNDSCPYCGGILNDSAHADHIIPVALGGLSTPSNMVIVCASCNLKKSDKTLREFISEFDLEREKIEWRLEKLGKRF